MDPESIPKLNKAIQEKKLIGSASPNHQNPWEVIDGFRLADPINGCGRQCGRGDDLVLTGFFSIDFKN